MSEIISNNKDIMETIQNIYKNAEPEDLRKLIAKHLMPTIEEKKKFAEIPTPVSLVDEMLEKIPSVFWTNPKTILEPCCGKGNFIIGIFDKQYDGLKEYEANDIKRCELIITKCLYYGDITALNVFITTELLKCHIKSKTGQKEVDYEFNSYVGDTLDEKFKNAFKINKFNAVIGNPPYNASGATGTGNTIWQKFTKKALDEWIIRKGYLLFVHPSGWRKPNTVRGKFTRLFDLMTKENQLVYLEIHGNNDGVRTFNKGTRYDLYLIERIEKYKETVVIDESGIKTTLDLSALRWLPNSNVDYIIKNIIAKGDEERCQVVQSTSLYESRKAWMSHTMNAEFRYPCIHSTPKKGTRYMYSKINDNGHFGISKVIFGDSGIYNPVIDMDGKYGMTEHCIGIEIKTQEEGNCISKVIQSEKFMNILSSCLFSSFAIDRTLFKEFKKDFWKEFM